MLTKSKTITKRSLSDTNGTSRRLNYGKIIQFRNGIVDSNKRQIKFLESEGNLSFIEHSGTRQKDYDQSMEDDFYENEGKYKMKEVETYFSRMGVNKKTLKKKCLMKILNEKLKENTLLRCFIKEIEELINKKENIGKILEIIQQVNNSKTSEIISDILNKKLQDQNPKLVKNIVVITSKISNSKKENELKATISQLNAKIERQSREIKTVREELIQLRSGNKSLSLLFESCVKNHNDYYISKNKHCYEDEFPISIKSTINDLSSQDKETLLQRFLQNDIVLKKLADIVTSQFGYKNNLSNNISFPLSTHGNVSSKIHENLSGTSNKLCFHIPLYPTKITNQGKSLPKIAIKRTIKLNEQDFALIKSISRLNNYK